MTREEAINEIKSWDFLKGKEIEVIHTLIPELIISEDERIRKWLIDYFKSVGKSWIHRDISPEQILSWLEKQKEQKSTKINEYEIIKKHITYDILSSEVNKRLKECGWYVTDEKPTEWDEYTKINLDRALQIIKDAKGTLRGYQSDDGIYECDKAIECLEHFLYRGLEIEKPTECLKAERDGWYVCIKDYYRGGKKQSSVGDLVQAKGGMFIMGEENISEWFRRAYYEEVRDAFEPNADTNIPEQSMKWSEDYNEGNIQTRFAFYTYKDDPCTLYLSNVFVEETSRNKGFGTKILAAAEKVAEIIGATTICLKVKQNSPANAWYRKNGYDYVAFEDGYDWLEKDLKYMKFNKQEWDEFDEDCLKRAVWYIENPAPSVVKDTNLVLWLKSLPGRFNLQSKQTYNEDDEDIIYSLRSFLIQAEQSGRYGSIQIAQIEQCLNWLKSLPLKFKKENEE